MQTPSSGATSKEKCFHEVSDLALRGWDAAVLRHAYQAADVRTDYDHGANFENHHTCAWGNVQTDNLLYIDRIKSAVNQDLQQAKGWQLAPSGGSATVFATGSVKDEQELETTYNDFGGGWGRGFGFRGFGGDFGGGEATITTQQQPVGHLLIDVLDSSNHALLFPRHV